MKIAAIAVMTAIVGIAAPPKQPQRKVKVYLRESPRVRPEVRAPALDLANKMFATIGIRLERCSGELPHAPIKRHIGIELATDYAPDVLPGALGSAMPFEGVHIRVFYDRIRSEIVPRFVLLAHVLVHEITHILQGTDQHSESGIMKASWTHQDHLQMRTEPLPFTPRDIELIHEGLASRVPDVQALAAEELDPCNRAVVRGSE
jgi:hypothetical protein